MSFGKTIELFLVNGTVESLMTAELSNWNGKAIKSPVQKFPDAAAQISAELVSTFCSVRKRTKRIPFTLEKQKMFTNVYVSISAIFKAGKSNSIGIQL